jgi:hypothetical protein
VHSKGTALSSPAYPPCSLVSGRRASWESCLDTARRDSTRVCYLWSRETFLPSTQKHIKTLQRELLLELALRGCYLVPVSWMASSLIIRAMYQYIWEVVSVASLQIIRSSGCPWNVSTVMFFLHLFNTMLLTAIDGRYRWCNGYRACRWTQGSWVQTWNTEVNF